MLAALALALSIGVQPRACGAGQRLTAEQVERRLDEAAVSPPRIRLAQRACLAGAAFQKLGQLPTGPIKPLSLSDTLERFDPDADPQLLLGRSYLFAELAQRLRDLCAVDRPHACGLAAAKVAAWTNVTPIDQSELGFALWLKVEPGRAASARRVAAFLKRGKVGDILPLYQVLRTASDWQACGGEPFALPPAEDWTRAQRTLGWIRDRVKPAVGEVEAKSGWRPPALNACADGAKESAHLGFWALDLEPLDPAITRADLMDRLCRTHQQFGQASDIGLGFYSGVRFHIDDKRYRHWGFDVEAAPACAGATVPALSD